MLTRCSSIILMVICANTATAADFFKIATFNIEHLGRRTPGQQPIAIAEHFDLCGADVISIQEIYVTETIGDDMATPYDESRRNGVLDTAFAILNSEGDADWKYEVFPNRTAGDTSQLCGVAWNAKTIVRDQAAYAIPIVGQDAGSVWDRRPHAVKLGYIGGKTDIILIPVHMKSNYDSASEGRNTREKEAATLVSQLPAISGHFDGEDDIVIAGDTNFLSSGEPAALLLSAAGYRDTNSLDLPTYIGTGDGAPFDRFFLRSSPEFAFARQYILQAAEAVAHDGYLSDHQMALISFRVKADND